MTGVEWLLENSHIIPKNELNKRELIDKAKKMENIQSFPNVNRVEVIQHSEPYNGRAYTNYNAKNVEVQLQDNGKTLKIFLR